METEKDNPSWMESTSQSVSANSKAFAQGWYQPGRTSRGCLQLFSGVYQQSTVQYLPWAEVGRVGRMDERAYPCIDGEVTWMGKEGRMKRCVRERTRSARSRKVISKSTWVYVT